MYYMIYRETTAASKLLLSCVSTFTSTELCSYEQYIFYTVVVSIITLDRPALQKILVKDPQIISAMQDDSLQLTKKFLHSVSDREYKHFFQALLELHPRLQEDRYLGPHIDYLLREYRVLVYTQFLLAYRSVRLTTMAESFGISSELLDKELARFIAAGRLSAKVDKVKYVVETIRSDNKNTQYQEMIKKGDALLNSVQKLARVIEM